MDATTLKKRYKFIREKAKDKTGSISGSPRSPAGAPNFAVEEVDEGEAYKISDK